MRIITPIIITPILAAIAFLALGAASPAAAHGWDSYRGYHRHHHHHHHHHSGYHHYTPPRHYYYRGW